MQPIRRILIPTDFSPPAEAAARYGIDLARQLGAAVTLFHAYTVPLAVPFPDGSGYLPTADGVADTTGLIQAELVGVCERVRVPGIEIHLAMAEGPAKQVIARIARESGF